MKRQYWLVFILWTTMLLQGCTTEYNLATRREESLLYGTEKEVKIGEAIAPKIEEEYAVLSDVDVNERVEAILARIAAVCDRKDLVYFIKVLDDDPINAVSLPGGYVYVFRGL
ncbi:MAG TPA: peptidase, partial [Candidatus Omnitrophota bacterium]|nr:peptidase [Candidatus Omnitrophota bacterium]